MRELTLFLRNCIGARPHPRYSSKVYQSTKTHFLLWTTARIGRLLQEILQHRNFSKNILHSSGYMLIHSLFWSYNLKDVSGILQPRFISFGRELKINRLRMKNRLAEIGISFGAKRLTALSHERKLKDGHLIVQPVIYYIIDVYHSSWRMKDIFANS